MNIRTGTDTGALLYFLRFTVGRPNTTGLYMTLALLLRVPPASASLVVGGVEARDEGLLPLPPAELLLLEDCPSRSSAHAACTYAAPSLN